MTMILVTHDVDEAIYLGSRVVIMTPRPGRIKEIVPIALDARDRVSDEFAAYRKQLLKKLHFDAHEVHAGNSAAVAASVQEPATVSGWDTAKKED